MDGNGCSIGTHILSYKPGIDGYVVQEAAVLLLEFLQLKRPVSLGGETGLFLSLGL